jgi:hypothetical protein
VNDLAGVADQDFDLVRRDLARASGVDFAFARVVPARPGLASIRAVMAASAPRDR